MSKQLHATVHGKVQGVFFRAWTQEQGSALNLSGWVRNRPDGTVEVRAQGEDKDLKGFEKRLHQGPPAARVDAVDAEYTQNGEPVPDGFQILYS